LLLDRSLQLLAALLATQAMASIERRPLRSYGFNRTNFVRLYCRGVVAGFAALSMLLGVLCLGGVWQIYGLHLHGTAILQYGLAWGLAFAVTALSEESQIRGYLLTTLTRGTSFWVAAILLALFFGALHLGNGAENYVGIGTAVMGGVAFSYIIRQTGSLAFAFGLHASWDWTQSFFYGTPNSGQTVKGYLFESHTRGNPLIGGGSAGPEGSLLAIVVFLLLPLTVRWIRSNDRCDCLANRGMPARS
jgi:uncharacterized protein